MKGRIVRHKIRISVGQTRLLIKLILDAGRTADELKKETGIDPSGSEDPDFSILLDQYCRLWQYAVDVTGDPALALHLGQRHRKTMLGFGKRMAQYSKDLNEALEHWGSYNWMSLKAVKREWRREGNRLILSHGFLSPENQSIHMVEYALSVVYNYACYITDRDLPLIGVHFIYPEPEYGKEYKKVFPAKVLFGQEENALIIPSGILDTPIIFHDPLMVSVLDEFARNRRKGLEQHPTMSERVVEYIIANLPKGSVSVDRTADDFYMNRSTLLRKLRQEGTTFKDLLENTRRELAQSYLKQNFSASEITYLLGYSSPSSFQHSFKRWFGISTGEMKRALMPERS